ncbi:hypothetical protein HZS55_15695 [Halosimplex rubrum]|uniref:Uncharacterized protein n=1 Tax=Halosimplex rubrum TaxID=869889 RepID=A0A7D5P1F4_9EURY|nr:hypothetical protein [Halosimplex rubrum]QLH78643.1 hypothetical protein HZS55_15695 [Halosimplex rubrum]
MSDLDVPEKFEGGDWPFEAKRYVLAEANTAADLRDEIDAMAGLPADEYPDNGAGRFTKDQLAAIVMALGGPRGADVEAEA